MIMGLCRLLIKCFIGISAFFAIMFLSACSNELNKTQKTIIKKEPPKKPKIIKKRHKGTLYAQAGTSLFADKKDLNVGDIVQIQVDELLLSTSKNQKDLTKDSTGTASLSFGGTVRTDAALQSKSKFKFKGNEKNAVSERFSTSISAVITQRYDNGNYFVLGHSQIIVGGNTQTLEISGIIRPYDITSENSVKSTQIANLQLKYNKVGIDGATTTQPWLQAIVSFLWPF